MQTLSKSELIEEIREKEKIIEQQNHIIEILRESNDLIKKVNKKVIAQKEQEIDDLQAKISQLQEELKKKISLLA
ncbi:MAG: hypothetical protein JW891_09070 [Candidatus Lokiarchaeota archaeon]|nr:hypothetical protein [Candidatus Lokiarchaeota archaeon]